MPLALVHNATAGAVSGGEGFTLTPSKHVESWELVSLPATSASCAEFNLCFLIGRAAFWRAAGVNAMWVWVKIKPPGDRRFWSLFQFASEFHFGYLFLTHSHVVLLCFGLCRALLIKALREKSAFWMRHIRAARQGVNGRFQKTHLDTLKSLVFGSIPSSNVCPSFGITRLTFVTNTSSVRLRKIVRLYQFGDCDCKNGVCGLFSGVCVPM